jgi:hypothetical protein
MKRRIILLAALPLSLAACAGTAQSGRMRRYSGTWDYHFETSSFTTDEGDGPWWLSGDGETWPQLSAPLNESGRPWGRLELVVEGELSEPGQYGHLGAYAHELRVTRVISARLIERDSR